MKPIIDHIQITVRDIKIAEHFYDRLLPLLGFDIQRKVSAVIEEHDFYVVEYSHPAITLPIKEFIDDTINRRKLGALHYLAFRSESRVEVGRLYFELKEIGATIVHKPKLYPGIWYRLLFTIKHYLIILSSLI